MQKEKNVVDNSKIIERKKDYQLQSNDISNGIYSCSAIARRLIAYCISNAYKDSIEMAGVYADEELTQLQKLACMKASFSFNDFCKKMGMKQGTKTFSQIKNAVKECMKSIITIEQFMPIERKKKWCAYSWFVESYVDEENEKVNMTFNPLIYKAIIAWYFNNKGYSALKLELLGQLRSFYAMRYYELALSQMGHIGKNGNEKGKWFFERTISELKTLFEIQDVKSYEKTETFINKVVRLPIEELNEKNKDFQISVIKIKENRKTIGLRFLCIATSDIWKIQKTDSFEDKKIKEDKNKYSTEINFYKTKFPKLWKKWNEIARAENLLPFGFEINDDLRTLDYVKTELSDRLLN